jgi:hypothetical protein
MASESKAWLDVLGMGRQLQGSRVLTVQAVGNDLVRLANRMRAQLVEGVHENPPLVVYGNPPIGFRGAKQVSGRFAGKMSSNVYEVRYRHFEDDKDYRHPFEPGTDMWAIVDRGERQILLTRDDGAPLWEDF